MSVFSTEPSLCYYRMNPGIMFSLLVAIASWSHANGRHYHVSTISLRNIIFISIYQSLTATKHASIFLRFTKLL